ncbi:hypothetical protein BLA29_002825 [Euroglyphus maynei]|uniref:Uncharacterized protein n=1 Tax=Euroglyphus maynei TaxID=6958 RepID=A0A1Y3ALA2_EURMA|nr:hypothetical protein BLA29_002825 [Euroglyphus maynei]
MSFKCYPLSMDNSSHHYHQISSKIPQPPAPPPPPPPPSSINSSSLLQYRSKAIKRSKSIMMNDDEIVTFTLERFISLFNKSNNDDSLSLLSLYNHCDPIIQLVVD